MASSRQEYFNKYAEYAMLQMERYGIPASITLAQGAIESADGKSRLANIANNHFGVKGAYNGNYVLANDDKPNEHFKKYDSVVQSYEDHSKVLIANRYQKYVGKLALTDYKGWAAGIKAGGYATAKNYVNTIVSVIESNNLQKYDQMVIEKLKREGKSVGVAGHPLSADAVKASGKATGFNLAQGKYSFPMECDKFLLVTSDFGHRVAPKAGASSDHKGIDINARSARLLATEDNGKVVKVSQDGGNAAGKYVTVEYDRGNGKKTQFTYMHMSSINVKVGDVVNAGDKLGVSGKTGNVTGEHLHFEVKQFNEPGKFHYVDPAAYLAEINAKGNIDKELRDMKGKNLLASYQPSVSDGQAVVQQKEEKQEELTPQNWLTKLLSADSGVVNGQSDGLISSLLQMFFAMMLLSKTFEKKSLTEKIEATTKMALERKVNISDYTPGLKSSSLVIGDNGKVILATNNGDREFRHVLTDSEYARLNQVLTSDLSDDMKRQKISSIVYGISYSQQASVNYDKISSQQRSQEESLKR